MNLPFIRVGSLVVSCIGLAACAPRGAAPTAGGDAAIASGPPPAISYEAHVPAGGIAPVGADLKNPYVGDPTAAKSGAALFVAMNCDGCHGSDGSGWVGPSLADGRWRYGGADSEVFASIYYGRPKGMPAFGGAISQDGIWTMVSYLKSLSPPPTVPTESWSE